MGYDTEWILDGKLPREQKKEKKHLVLEFQLVGEKDFKTIDSFFKKDRNLFIKKYKSMYKEVFEKEDGNILVNHKVPNN